MSASKIKTKKQLYFVIARSIVISYIIISSLLHLEAYRIDSLETVVLFVIPTIFPVFILLELSEIAVHLRSISEFYDSRTYYALLIIPNAVLLYALLFLNFHIMKKIINMWNKRSK